MMEKIVDLFTPEMTIIVIGCLAVLALFTFLLVLMTIASLSRVKKRLLAITGKCLALEEEHASLQQARQTMSNNVAHLVEVDEKIQSIEGHLDECDNKITERQDQLTGYESKLKEYDTLLGQAGQMMGKEAADFNQAVQRIHVLEDEFQGLKAFQRSLEQMRQRILNALDASPTQMPPQYIPNTEPKTFKEDAAMPSEPNIQNLEDLYKSRMNRYP